MRKTVAVTAMLVVGAALAPAQNPPPGQPAPPGQAPPAGDTAPRWGPGMGPMMGPGFGNPQRIEMLRAQIEERWGRMVQQRLQLNDQQMDRLRAAIRANQDRRRDLMRRQADLERAIGAEMRPGVAANNDSLNRMLDAMGRLRVEHAQSDQQLLRELSFLTPVQRAQFFMMARRFEERMRGIRERVMGGPGQGGMMQPMGPGRRGPRMWDQPPQPQAAPGQPPPRPQPQ